MLDKNNFCLIVDGMKEDFDRSHKIYEDLKKYSIYVDREHEPLDIMLEKLIRTNFNDWQSYEILNYAYPIKERENISSAELYDRITENLGDED